MSAFVAEFRLLHPWWLLALLPLPWLVRMLWRRQRGRAELARLADPEMLPLLVAGVPHRRRPDMALLALGWLLAVLALAGPAWERLPEPMQNAGSARVVALSLSRAMLSADITPDRLTRARFKVRDLVGAGRGDENALVAYAGDAFVVTPLTPDADTVLNLLDALAPDTMPVDGNDAARAIDLGMKLLAQAGVHGGDIVLVTDAADAAAADAARRARAAGVHVSVLGVGSDAGGPVPLPGGGFLKDAHGDIVVPRMDAASLRAVATAGGGRYRALATDDSDVDALLAGAHAGHTDTRSSRQAHADQWRDRGPWLLLPLLPLAALAFRRGWLAVLALALLLPLGTSRATLASGVAPVGTTTARDEPVSRRASWWDALWRNRDQRAAAALAEGDADRAAVLAHAPGLAGAARYRAGDYATAAETFAAQPGADAAYNLGNALAREARYKEAMDAYDHALELAPGMDDARYNRQLVQDKLKQQQQQQQQQQSSGHSQGGKGGQDKSPGTSSPGEQGGGGDTGQQPAAPSSADSRPDSGAGPSASGNEQDDGAESRQTPSAASSVPSPGTAATPADEDGKQRQAEQAVKRAMDQRLHDGPAQAPYRLGHATEEGRQDTLPQPMRQALERVPDDPGGLLRRKFQREYQLRQGRGGDGG